MASRPTAVASITMSSIFMSVYLAAMGPMIAARPMARPTLAMLLPTTFPMMSDGVSVLTMDVIASGAEDPKASTVSPTTNGAIPKCRARPFAPRTSHSEPKYSMAVPAIRHTAIQNMDWESGPS